MLTVKDGPGFYRGLSHPEDAKQPEGLQKLAPQSPLQRAKLNNNSL